MYQNVTLHRVDGSQNIFDEFLKTLATKLSDLLISNGENILLGLIILIFDKIYCTCFKLI